MDVAPVGFHHLFGDRQTQAISGELGGKAFGKNQRQIFGGNARAGVGHRNFDVARRLMTGDFKDAAVTHGFDGVQNQIQQRLAITLTVLAFNLLGDRLREVLDPKT